MRFLPLCLILVLTACLPYPVASNMESCPVSGLQQVVFFDGKPPGGVRLSPVTVQPNSTHGNDLSDSKNGTYVVCHYSDGHEQVQILSTMLDDCTVDYAGNQVKSFSCRGSI